MRQILKRLNRYICFNPAYFLDSENCDGCSLRKECSKDLEQRAAEDDYINQEIALIKKEG